MEPTDSPLTLVVVFDYRGEQSLNLDECFRIVNKLLDAAGGIVNKNHEAPYQFACQNIAPVGQQIHEFLVKSLTTRFPSHKFIMEPEKGGRARAHILTDTPTWIISPLDGANNFEHGFPYSCISIALVVKKVTQIGVVYNPIMRQLYWARHERGAYYNGRRLEVSASEAKPLSKALVASEFGVTSNRNELQQITENFAKISGKAHAIRCLGSPTLNMCMVALGMADASYQFGVHAWDVCAADLIVREAGGVVLDTSGEPFDLMSRRVLAASHPDMAQEIAETLTQIFPKPRDDEQPEEPITYRKTKTKLYRR